jgi:hypothetical protein
MAKFSTSKRLAFTNAVLLSRWNERRKWNFQFQHNRWERSRTLNLFPIFCELRRKHGFSETRIGYLVIILLTKNVIFRKYYCIFHEQNMENLKRWYLKFWCNGYYSDVMRNTFCSYINAQAWQGEYVSYITYRTIVDRRSIWAANAVKNWNEMFVSFVTAKFATTTTFKRATLCNRTYQSSNLIL